MIVYLMGSLLTMLYTGFKCSTCESQLDSGTNLLLLDNGSLVCGNCSYYCSICQKRIEGTAILTGDQAFCSPCFTCRNCRRKIKGRRYAKTSQGIFCMNCHEALLARKKRRQEQKLAAAQAKQRVLDQQISLAAVSEDNLPHGSINSSTSSLTSAAAFGSRTSVNLIPTNALHNRHSISQETLQTLPARMSAIIPGKDKSLPSLPPKYQEENLHQKARSDHAGSDSSFAHNLEKYIDDRDHTHAISPVASLNGESNIKRRSRDSPFEKPSTFSRSSDIFGSAHSSANPSPTHMVPRKPVNDYFELPRHSPELAPDDDGIDGSGGIIIHLEEGLQLDDNNSFSSMSPPSREQTRTPVEEPAAEEIHPSPRINYNSKHSGGTAIRAAIYVSDSTTSIDTSHVGLQEQPKGTASSTDGPSSSASSVSSMGKEDQVDGSAISTPHISASEDNKLLNFQNHLTTNRLDGKLANEKTPTDENYTLPSLQPDSATLNIFSNELKPSERDLNLMSEEQIERIIPHRSSLRSTSPRPPIRDHKPILEVPMRSREASPRPSGLLNGVPRTPKSAGSFLTEKYSSKEPPHSSEGPPSGDRPSSFQYIKDGDATELRRHSNNVNKTPSSSNYSPVRSSRALISADLSTQYGSALETPSSANRSLTKDAESNKGSALISAPIFQSSSTSVEPASDILNSPLLSAGDQISSPNKPRSKLGHRRSISDKSISARQALAAVGNVFSGGHSRSNSQNSTKGDFVLNSNSSRGHHRASSNAALTVDLLTKELAFANQRIAELEVQVHAQNNRVSEQANYSPDASVLEVNIQEKRNTIAELEARHVATRKELEVLQTVTEEVSSKQVVGKFAEELQLVKSQLIDEISVLTVQRDSLRADTAKASANLNKAIEESSLLNIKNTQLADMNNELTKQLIEKFGNFSNSPVPSFKDYLKKGHQPKGSNELNSLPLPSSSLHNPSLSSSSLSNNQSTAAAVASPSAGDGYDPPMVTVLDGGAGDKKKEVPGNRGRFWKRPGAAVAKGLGRVFANEEQQDESMSPYTTPGNPSKLSSSTSISNGMSSIGEGLVTSTTTAGGLGIVFPGTTSAGPSGGNNANRGAKTGKNGWFSSSAQHRNMSPGRVPVGSTKATDSKESTLMGASLESRIALEGNRIPSIVTLCAAEVEQRGMEFEGIYRKSGAVSHRQAIEDEFEKRWDGDFSEELSGDICAVTSALKQYLRYLPDPLITYDKYDGFIQVGTQCASKADQSAIGNMQTLVQSLSAAHRDCLEFVIKHLVKVTTYSNLNLMTSKNLAVVFAPTLARDQTGAREMIDMAARNDATQLLIDYCEQIFMV